MGETEFNFKIKKITNAFIMVEGEKQSYFKSALSLAHHIREVLAPNEVKTRTKKSIINSTINGSAQATEAQ